MYQNLHTHLVQFDGVTEYCTGGKVAAGTLNGGLTQRSVGSGSAICRGWHEGEYSIFKT